MSHRISHRIVAPAAISALALTMATPALTPVAQAQPPAPEAARSASSWLATQLTNGVVHNDLYDSDDFGMTLDIGLSMGEVGGDAGMVRQIRNAMSTRVDSYVTGIDFDSPDERYSGAMAKSLVFAQVSGADPRTYGGRDLVSETEGLVIPSGPSAGRLQDLSEYGDYANTFGQALAARGLADAGSPKAAAATGYLLQQQCDAGYFRVFFTSDKQAAEQGCVDGEPSSPTDTDATAMAVSQLAAIETPTPQVTSAINRGAAWLAGTQRTDGSFVGSAFTPDPNSNSTGLAASALAAAGDCLRAGRAAEWVTSVQVGPQPGGSPLAGDEGAIAYSADALAAAGSDGIGLSLDQWRRATVQSVAGLTHRLGAVHGTTVLAPASTPGSAVTLEGSGAREGDRLCLSGPGIVGSRTVVVRGDGTFAARVTAPAAPGAASYTLQGRDGAKNVAVEIRPTAGPPSLASVAGVRLVGPRGPQAAGSRVALRVTGAGAGARYTLGGGGLSPVTVVAGSDGDLSRVVTLPASAGRTRFTLTGRDGTSTARVEVLKKQRLKVKVKQRAVAAGKRQRVVVRRLAAGERVRIVVAGKQVARTKANASGTAKAGFRVPRVRGRVVVVVTGELPAIRWGKTSFRIR